MTNNPSTQPQSGRHGHAGQGDEKDPYRVLVIDDSRSIHEDFRKILQPNDTESFDEAEAALFGRPSQPPPRTRFAVDSAYQGEEGLNLVRRARGEGRPYAVAFLDIRMPPGWDGVETATRLWSEDLALQIVLCTAYSDYTWEDLRRELKAPDNLVILKKPFDTVEVLQLAHALARKWSLARQSRRRLEELDRLVDERTVQLRVANAELVQEVAERKAAEQRVWRLNRLQSVLSKVNELTPRIRSRENLCAEACRLAVEEGKLKGAWVGIVEPGSTTIKPIANCGFASQFVENLKLSCEAEVPEAQGPTGTAIREGRCDIRHDLEHDARLKPWQDLFKKAGYKSLAAFPLRVKGRVAGALTLCAAEPQFFSEQEVRLLDRLAVDLSFGIEFLAQEAELKLQRTALEAAANGIVITSSDGLVCWHNAAFTRLTGYTSDEIVGRNASLLKSGKHDAAFYQTMWQTILSGKVWRGELTNRRKDGSLYNEEMTITPVSGESGTVTHFVAIKQEITDRKRAEARLAALSSLGQRLSSALTAREAALIIVDVADRLVGWDACACELYSSGEDRLRHLLTMDVINGRRTECTPDRLEHAPISITRRAIQAGGQLLLRDSPDADRLGLLAFGDAGRPSASLMFVPIRHGLHIIGVLSIQSYTPKAYDQHSLDTLQALADHCAGALERIDSAEERKELEKQLRHAQKMEAIGQLAGGIAHDFNNLLAVIRGNTELALLEPDQFSTETRECLVQVTTAAERAANLTRQLLAFSRKQVMQSQPLNLNLVIGNMTKMLKRIIGEHIELNCSLPERLPLVQADVGMIEQVLVNLVVNARDAMPKGGKLSISTGTISIESGQAWRHPDGRPGQFVWFNIGDTGTGIAPENLPRIFEPFFTTKPVGKGTGLGLATAYGIIHQHHGWIEVASQVGVGTSFQIMVPAIEAHEPQAAESDQAGLQHGHGERILLVEDEQAVRSLTRRLLEKMGYAVTEAIDGPQALQSWRDCAGQIDLLLTDVVMPGGLNGRELAEQLRAERPDLRIILMSGYSEEFAGRDTAFMRRNRARFLQKPCAPRALLQAVRECLDDN